MGNGPIRIAQVMGKMNGGGVESVVMNYYRHVNREAVQFDFFVDNDSLMLPREEIELLGGRVIDVTPYQNLPRYWRELESLFKENSYRIVHSHLTALSVFPLGAAKSAGVPVRIAHAHNTGGKGEYAKNAIRTMLRPFSNVYPTHRFACSRHAGEWLFGKNAQFEVVYNAIELDRFTFDAEKRAQIRADLGISEDTLVVGHVGRFMAQKNHDFLLDVFFQLHERKRNTRLLLVGEGNLKTRLEEKVRALHLDDCVSFVGQRDDIDRLYQAFDVFCLPSIYEGLGLVAIEGQRAGLPCFVSDCVPKEVDITGTVVFLPIDNPNVWVNAISAIEPTKRLQVQNQAFSNYDIEKAAHALQSKYLELEL